MRGSNAARGEAMTREGSGVSRTEVYLLKCIYKKEL